MLDFSKNIFARGYRTDYVTNTETSEFSYLADVKEDCRNLKHLDVILIKVVVVTIYLPVAPNFIHKLKLIINRKILKDKLFSPWKHDY